jgi:hypothetical protein
MHWITHRDPVAHEIAIAAAKAARATYVDTPNTPYTYTDYSVAERIADTTYRREYIRVCGIDPTTGLSAR